MLCTRRTIVSYDGKTYVDKTYTYDVNDDPNCPTGPKFVREIINGRYISVRRGEKHQRTFYDGSKTVYLRRVE